MTRDRGALGLAVCLAALAAHALMTLAPGAPEPLQIGTRVIAYFLLPGWAATRLLFARRALGPFETAASMVACGTAIAVVTSFVARVFHWHPETAALVLAVLSLAVLAPRPAASEETPASAPTPARERSGASAHAPAGTPTPNARTRS